MSKSEGPWFIGPGEDTLCMLTAFSGERSNLKSYLLRMWNYEPACLRG